MRKLLLLLFVLSLGLSIPLKAQNMDEAMAAEFYRNGEFDKAAVLYKKLLDQHPSSAFFYDSYLNCILQLKDYSTAEKELKKLVHKNKDNFGYQIDLGYIYSLEGESRQSSRQFDDVLDALSPEEDRIRSVAAAFSRRNQTAYAIKTYLKGRKLMHDDMAFALELAGLYQDEKNYEGMFSEYMNLMESNPYEFESVREHMQEIVMQDEPYEIFKKILLKKTQANPDNSLYPDMLSWLFIQRHDFNSAFIQARALDKRLGEGGRRLIDLAHVVSDNLDYNLAEKIYQAVLSQGTSSPYFVPAQRGLLDLKYRKVTQSALFTPEDVAGLMQDYNKFLADYGMSRQESGEIVLRLAEIEAQYANKADKAIELLKKYITQPGIEKAQEAKAKLALGDYLILNGDVWEATLYYSQVEKMYKDQPLGHEAKFRNAKLSFYRGDFEWSKAQLDVLKSSTSELIANDAMQLALLIQDNIGLDTTEKPLRLYAEAGLLIFKNQFAAAEVKLDSINSQYPHHSLEDEILMSRADIAFRKHDYQKAADIYSQVYTNYGKDILGDDALYHAAVLYDVYLKQPQKAGELYEKLMLEYKGSVYTVEARNRFRQIRGDAVN